MQHGRKGQGRRQAKGVRQLLGQGERLLTALPGLVRIAQQPQDPGGIGSGNTTPGSCPVERCMGAVLLGVVEGDALL